MENVNKQEIQRELTGVDEKEITNKSRSRKTSKYTKLAGNLCSSLHLVLK
jgi:hypothetical protein